MSWSNRRVVQKRDVTTQQLELTAETEIEKATRQLGGLFFQGRIVLTEGKVRQNFLAKSYEPKKGGVKGFLDNKCLYFQ